MTNRPINDGFYDDDDDDDVDVGNGLYDDYDAENVSGSQSDDIQTILDRGYETLDQFVGWLENTLSVDTRAAQQDVFNAEALLDYLANYRHKPVAEIDEFDLRWFLFSHYIRKAMPDEETAERLPASLSRFFEFLRVQDGYEVPDWLYATLDDQPFYQTRRKAYAELDSEDERRWELGFRQWSQELEEDLDVRCLWLPREIGPGLTWGDRMGWREATLYDEANRLWQEERTELLQSGVDFETARTHLLSSYLLWTESPQEKLDEQTPLDVIQEEQQQRRDEDSEDDGSVDDDADETGRRLL